MAMDLSVGKGKKRGARPEMNVTPLVDVVLVLLIIFMVVTPLLSKQFWVHLPTEPREQNQAAPPPRTDGPPPVVVSVDRSGTVRVNQEVVALAELPRKLRRVLAARRERTVFFDAADDAPFDRAVAALDAARGGGAATIAVMTEGVVGR